MPLGPVGSGLIALGPAGTVAAVGIGAVIAALDKMNTAANLLADKSFAIKNFADAVGLTTDQVQGIIDVAAKFGVVPEAAQSFVEKFTVEMDQLRKGSGNLYDQLMRIDSGLAAQLAGAKSTAAAWNLVAKAYRDADFAGDVFRRNTIARAIGGARGVIGAGAVLSATADAGGLDRLTDDVRRAGGMIDSELIAKLAKLRTEIKQTRDDANTVFATIFSERVLENEKQFAEAWLEIAKAAKEFSLSPSLSTFMEFWSKGFSALQSDDAKSILASGEKFKRDQALVNAEGEIKRLADQRDGISRAIVSETDPRVVSNLAGELARVNEQIRIREKLIADSKRPQIVIAKPGEDVPLPTARPTPPAASGPVSAEFALQRMRTWTAVLGAAITPAEQLKLKIAELDAAQEKGGISSEVYRRAQAAATLAFDQAIASVRERIGIASQEEIVTQRLRELEGLRAKGFITNAADMVRAEQIIQKEARASAEALQVRAAALPGLKQFELEAGNVNKAIDLTATQGINDLTAAVSSYTMGNKKAAESAADFGLAIVSSINQMIVKMTIAAPIARSLQSIIGGFLPGGSGGTDLGGGIWPAARGAVFSEFANGGTFTNGIFSQPTFFRFANGGTPGLGVMGEAGDEAVMPLKRGAGGRLGVSATVPNVSVNLSPAINLIVDNRNGSKVSAGKPTPNQGGGFDLSVVVDQFEASVADNISSGRSPIGKSLEQNYGMTRRFA